LGFTFFGPPCRDTLSRLVSMGLYYALSTYLRLHVANLTTICSQEIFSLARRKIIRRGRRNMRWPLITDWRMLDVLLSNDGWHDGSLTASPSTWTVQLQTAVTTITSRLQLYMASESLITKLHFAILRHLRNQ